MGDEFFGFAGHFGAERGALDDTDIGNFGGVEGFIGAGFFEAGLHVFEAGFFGIFFAFEFGDLGADEGDAGGLFLGGGELRVEGHWWRWRGERREGRGIVFRGCGFGD